MIKDEVCDTCDGYGWTISPYEALVCQMYNKLETKTTFEDCDGTGYLEEDE